MNYPEKVVLIKPIAGFGSNTTLTLNRETKEYECVLIVPITDENGKTHTPSFRVYFNADLVMLEKDTFLTEEQYNSVQIVEYKKRAINNLVEQLKAI